MQTHSCTKAVLIAGLVMAMAAPAVLPNVVFAQADVRQDDRRADRQQERQANHRAPTSMCTSTGAG